MRTFSVLFDGLNRQKRRQTESHKLVPTLHKNGETDGLALDLFDDDDDDDDDDFIEVAVTSLYAALHSYFVYPRNTKWHDLERSMYCPLPILVRQCCAVGTFGHVPHCTHFLRP